MFWYGLLEAFVKEHGHCSVPKHTKRPTAIGWVNGLAFSVYHKTSCQVNAEHDLMLWALIGLHMIRIGK